MTNHVSRPPQTPICQTTHFTEAGAATLIKLASPSFDVTDKQTSSWDVDQGLPPMTSHSPPPQVTVAWGNNSHMTLSEVYQLSADHEQRRTRVGSWVPPLPGEVRGQLRTPPKDVIPRRSDLTGLHLSCAVSIWT